MIYRVFFSFHFSLLCVCVCVCVYLQFGTFSIDWPLCFFSTANVCKKINAIFYSNWQWSFILLYFYPTKTSLSCSFEFWLFFDHLVRSKNSQFRSLFAGTIVSSLILFSYSFSDTFKRERREEGSGMYLCIAGPYFRYFILITFSNLIYSLNCLNCKMDISDQRKNSFGLRNFSFFSYIKKNQLKSITICNCLVLLRIFISVK